MRIKREYKLTSLSVTVIAIMLLSVMALDIPSASAADYPTYLFLTAQPNPIGVGQDASVVYWLDRAPPTASGPRGDRWQGWTMEITSPDGDVETLDLPDSDAAGSGFLKYTPAQVGTYSFKVTFPGQNITQGSAINWYKPSESATVKLTVQEEQIQPIPYTPLPTDYWSRPINAANHGWNQLGSNWLGTGGGPHGPRYYNINGNFNPYGTAPDAPHVMWTKEIAFGGIVGEETGDTNYFPGETYDRKFQPPIIMQGRLYYNQRLGTSAYQGLACVDLQTGEEIWFKEGTTITFGQLLNWQTPNVHGIIPHLWSISGSTYKMYDAFTGDWLLDIANVSSGSMIFGQNGEILIYRLNGAANTLSLWNSSKVLEASMSGDWYYRPVGPVIDGNNGYEWTVTVPDMAGSQSLLNIKDGVIYARATYTDGAPGTTKVGDVAYDISTELIKKDTNGNYPTSINNLWTPVNRTFEGSILWGYMEQDIIMTFVKETMVWYGFNVRTGAIAWGPTEPYENAWGVYQHYCDSQTANGILYAAGYDGMVHAYNTTTGENIWNFYADNSGLETVYGYYVFKDSAMSICDGKLYAVTNEHSPSTPLYRGSKMYCIDAVTGQGLWNVSFWGLFPVIADGYALSFNYYDGRIYCFGKGESDTSITTAPKVSTLGSSVLIEGKVIDKTPSAEGAAAVSDNSMAGWMEYLYMQQPKPTNATGVTVTLDVIDANGNYRNIGEVTTDLTGAYSYAWQPEISGKYTIFASYSGSDSYGSSFAETAIQVDDVSQPSTSPIADTVQPMTDTYVLGVGAAIIIAIAVVGAVIVLMVRKRP